MCDFDLYGCGMLNLSGGKFRGPLPEDDEEDEGTPGRITESTVPAHMLYPGGTEPPKDTHSTLEIDVLPHQIMNRNRLQERPLHQDFIELLHQPLHPEEKLVPAMKELWEDERRRRVAKGLGTSEVAMLPVSGGGRGRTMEELGYKVEGKEVNNRGGDWKISEELWELLQDRMDIERKRRGTLTFDRFSRDLANGKDGERKIYDRVGFNSQGELTAVDHDDLRSRDLALAKDGAHTADTAICTLGRHCPWGVITWGTDLVPTATIVPNTR
jgi:DNA polymerase zeta